MNDVFQSVIVPRAVGKRFRISFSCLSRLLDALAARGVAALRSEGGGARGLSRALRTLYAGGAAARLDGVRHSRLRIALRGRFRGVCPAAAFVRRRALLCGHGANDARLRRHRRPHGRLRASLSIFAAITGLALLSITTAYFFALFGSFQSREQFVVTVGARAGSPASGVNLLAIAGIFGNGGRSQRADARRAALGRIGDGEPSRVSDAGVFSFEPRVRIVGRNARHAARRVGTADDHRRYQMRPSPDLFQYRATRRTRSQAILRSRPRRSRASNARNSSTPATACRRPASPSSRATKRGNVLSRYALPTPGTSTR